jgi:hypothetical protein
VEKAYRREFCFGVVNSTHNFFSISNIFQTGWHRSDANICVKCQVRWFDRYRQFRTIRPIRVKVLKGFNVQKSIHLRRPRHGHHLLPAIRRHPQPAGGGRRSHPAY